MFANAQPLPGVPTLLHNLANCSTPQVHIALATSSSTATYRVKTGHLNHIFSTFHDERKILGDDPRIPFGRSKPAPDIFLLALKTINDGIRRDGNEPEIKPEECLVFEDSVLGIEAGRRAGMRVVWVPHPGLLKEYVGQEEKVLAGLTREHADTEQVAGVKASGNAAADGQSPFNYTESSPGAIGDGWGELLPSLENFPYERYGIRLRGQ
jgi:pseudouridine 5'-phosphatase